MTYFNYKKILIKFLIVFFIFTIDRLTKIYVITLAEKSNLVDIYVSQYLNIYLVWNKGIAFGLFSFDQSLIYNFITFLIMVIIIVIFIMIIRSRDINVYYLLFILGGSLGNLFDRIYYYAVPDFIDFHINNFHWFIFNVADIFISLGVLCLIITEIFFNKNIKNENL
jgi:signal peptidase II|tara:strand:- start:15 stop:515 length:501 start_codon:yes stop_codon:yes gene_type:complete